jgi:hypothetical protein
VAGRTSVSVSRLTRLFGFQFLLIAHVVA